MTVELIGDRKFIHTIRGQDGVWVLLTGKEVYALPAECGKALPVWASSDEAEGFARKLNHQNNWSPVFVPLSNFLGTAWLASPAFQITDVLASPKYGHEALTYSAAELYAKLKA
jgi:hypothetical protein